MRQISFPGRLAWEASGRILPEREIENDFIVIDFASVTQADAEAELFRAARPRNVGQFKRLEQSLASHVLDDLQQRDLSDALTLIPGIDHEAPDTDLRIRSRNS